MDSIYLDNNATTRPAPGVPEAMALYLTERFGNPSSAHLLGQESRYAIETAREQVASLVGARSNQIVFTSCGTESINTIIRSALETTHIRRIITSAVEHPATLSLCMALEKQGVRVEYIPVDVNGALDMDRLAKAVDEPAALATFLSANNETGVLFDIQRISEVCRSRKIPLHVDATQSAGKVRIDVAQMGADALSCSAHKFHGPKGVGILWVSRKLAFSPLLLGGPQETGRRAGTENTPAIVGAGLAAALAKESLPLNKTAILRDRLEREIVRTIEGSAIIAGESERLPNTTLIGFRSLQSQAILMALSERNICASAGSACASGSLQASHVLKAMGVDEKLAFGAVRFSLSRHTTEEEIGQTLEILPGVIEKLRNVLPAED